MDKCSWIVVSTYHERYSLETSIRIYHDYTFDSLYKEIGISSSNIDSIEKIRDKIYTIDFSEHTPLDTEYTYTELDGQPLEHLYLDSIMFMKLDDFLEDGFASYIWGSTNTKFGVIDIK